MTTKITILRKPLDDAESAHHDRHEILKNNPFEVPSQKTFLASAVEVEH